MGDKVSRMVTRIWSTWKVINFYTNCLKLSWELSWTMNFKVLTSLRIQLDWGVSFTLCLPAPVPCPDLESFSEQSYCHKYLSVDWHFFRDKSVAEDEIYIPRNLHTFENFNSPQMKIHETMLQIYRRDNQASPDLQMTAWIHFKYIFTLWGCFLIILLYSILKLNGKLVKLLKLNCPHA